MRAVDTNVLVRFFVADNPAQYRRARKVFESGALFIPKTVLLETEWILRAALGLTSTEILHAFGSLSAAADVEIEDFDTVQTALAWFADGMDFADALHIASRGGSVKFLTFDRRLATSARKAGIKGVVQP